MNLLEKIADKLSYEKDEIPGYLYDDCFILNDERTKKKLKITQETLKSSDYCSENKKITTYPFRGFKYGNYAEFNIIYGGESQKFKLGEVEVDISGPSKTFELLVGQTDDKFHDRTFITTISFRGENSFNLKDYMYQALFIIGNYFSDDYTLEYPGIEEFIGEDYYRYSISSFYIDKDTISAPDNLKNFPSFKHSEVLSFYNAGMEIRDHELSFQYFYKVLEHFFFINRADDFKEIIQQYNTKNNIKKFISGITNI